MGKTLLSGFLLLVLMGDIQTNQRWSGDVLFRGDVHLPRGLSARVAPDTHLYFEKGSCLFVEGNLHLDAHPGHPVKIFREEPDLLIAGAPLETEKISEIWRAHTGTYPILWVAAFSSYLLPRP